jgi:hypothetical protein
MTLRPHLAVMILSLIVSSPAISAPDAVCHPPAAIQTTADCPTNHKVRTGRLGRDNTRMAETAEECFCKCNHAYCSPPYVLCAGQQCSEGYAACVAGCK